MPMKTEELLELLACPRCHGPLSAVPSMEQPEGLACEACACVYPVREEIPIMLVEESVSRAEWDSGTRAARK